MINIISMVATSIISIAAIISNTFIAKFQTNKSTQLEREKMSLDIFADFLALCAKKSDGNLQYSELVEFEKLNAKLVLIADEELILHTKKLFSALNESPKSEKTLKLISEEKNLMRKRLENFNAKYPRK